MTFPLIKNLTKAHESTESGSPDSSEFSLAKGNPKGPPGPSDADLFNGTEQGDLMKDVVSWGVKMRGKLWTMQVIRPDEIDSEMVRGPHGDRQNKDSFKDGLQEFFSQKAGVSEEFFREVLRGTVQS